MADEARLTIGQEFAARWIARKYKDYQDKGTPEDLFGKISNAVDVYVEKQQTLFLSRLRDVAVKAADGESADGSMSFSSDQILEDNGLAGVAQGWSTPFQRTTRFPV